MEQALLNYLNTTQKLLLVHMRIFLCVSQSPVSQLSRLMIFRDFWKQCANVCLTKNWHNGGKARAVTLQQRGVFNKLPHCPVWCSGNNLHTHCASQVNPRLRTSFWGNLMREKDWLHGKVEFLHGKFWVFVVAANAQWTLIFIKHGLLKQSATKDARPPGQLWQLHPQLSMIGLIAMQLSHWGKTYVGGVLSGIINSPCIVTPLLRRKVKLRAVCKAVPLQQQCSDWGSA